MSYDEIQRNKARRLLELKKRQALQGTETPASIEMEIETLEAEGIQPAALLAAFGVPAWFNWYAIVTASGVTASLLIGILDFILILALRGHP